MGSRYLLVAVYKWQYIKVRGMRKMRVNANEDPTSNIIVKKRVHVRSSKISNPSFDIYRVYIHKEMDIHIIINLQFPFTFTFTYLKYATNSIKSKNPFFSTLTPHSYISSSYNLWRS